MSYCYSEEKGIIKINGLNTKNLPALKKVGFGYDEINNLFYCIWSHVNIRFIEDKLGIKVDNYIKEGKTISRLRLENYYNTTIPNNISKGMLSYQIDGLRRLKAGWSMLAFAPGLGKTLCSLRYLKLVNSKKSVVVCPAFLKENWANEVKKWTDYEPYIINGTKFQKFPEDKILIINYDIIQYHLKELVGKNGIDVLIADEVHMCRNNTIRTKTFMKMANKSKKTIGLTGTPIVNNAQDIYLFCKTVDKRFNSKTTFISNYCIERDFRIVGSKNMDKLNKILRDSIIFRKTKNDKDVIEAFKSLGTDTEVIQEFIPIELKARTEYKEAFIDIDTYFMKRGFSYTHDVAMLQRTRVLKDIVFNNKKQQAFEWLDNYLLDGKKICLFFQYTEHLEEFANKYPSVTINGNVDANKRNNILEDFKNSKKQVLCGNVNAMGVGLNIPFVDTCAFIDIPFNYSDINQCYSRFARIGQLSPYVTVYYIVGKNTIEDSYLLGKIDNKTSQAMNIVDGKEIEDNKNLTKMSLQ